MRKEESRVAQGTDASTFFLTNEHGKDDFGMIDRMLCFCPARTLFPKSARWVVLLLLLPLFGCIHDATPSHGKDWPDDPAAPYSESTDEIKHSVFIDAVNRAEQKVSPTEKTVQLPWSNEADRPAPEKDKKHRPDKTPVISGGNTELDTLNYDQRVKERLLRRVYKRLKLVTHTPFDIVDAAAVGIKFNRGIQISSADYQGSLGSLEIERGSFDLLFTSMVNKTRDFSNGPDSIRTDTSNLSVDLEQLFRMGIRVTASEDVTGTENKSSLSASQDSGSNLKFQLTVPLLKGRGRVSAAAGEESAKLALKAAGVTTEHTCASTVKTIGDNYWDYLLSVRLLDLAIDAECRSEKILDDTRILVKREAKPRSLLSSLDADLATKRGERYSRKQEVFRSRNQLAFNLGIPVRHAALLPVPSMTFPEIALENAEHLVKQQEWLYAVALKRRKDLHAARLNLQSDEVLENKARRDLLPDLNLTLSKNLRGWEYGNSGNDMVHALDNQDNGYVCGLVLTAPFQNNAARGQLRLRRGRTESSRLLYQDSQEQIYNDVTVSVSALHQACAQLGENRMAEKMYRRALSDEIQCFRLGKSTIFDVMDTQDRLNSALSSVVSAQTTVAKAIMALRYQTGMLFTEGEGDRKSLAVENFVTVPIPDARPE
ncbi:MAG: TolC family protein [Deltaproteobacteria bacterium]|nr:TolC family protein [Deltaproteobacteria bacterium]